MTTYKTLTSNRNSSLAEQLNLPENTEFDVIAILPQGADNHTAYLKSKDNPTPKTKTPLTKPLAPMASPVLTPVRHQSALTTKGKNK